MTTTIVPRRVTEPVRDALADTRVVTLNGARQVGKSTLARLVLSGDPTARQVTLDDPASLNAARSDPVTFVKHEGTLLIDEVQRAPELFLPIKASVDQDPRPGRFLLTGSAELLAIPRLSDSLAGRMEIIDLWPFSQGELDGTRERFIDELLDHGAEAVGERSTLGKRDYLDRATRGGFPEVVARKPGSGRYRWFESYLRTVTERDIRDLVEIERGRDVPRLLRLLAGRSAQLLKHEEIARDAGLPRMTARRYVRLLETLFVIRIIPGWSASKTTRVVRAPKVYVSDTGLLAHLLNVETESLMDPTGHAGSVLETFVVMELLRQLGWATHPAELFHLRTKDGVEVDAVIEARDGRIAAVEVKAGATVRSEDFRGLRYLASKAGNRFRGGVILYSGSEPLSFEHGLWAVPMSSLWECA